MTRRKSWLTWRQQACKAEMRLKNCLLHKRLKAQRSCLWQLYGEEKLLLARHGIEMVMAAMKKS